MNFKRKKVSLVKTKVAIIKDIRDDIDYIKEAGSIIKDGGIVAFPTETVYGLGADALNSEAVKKIFIAKGRPQDNPLIVHVSSKDLSNLVKDVPKVAQDLMNKFWPGPLTIILDKKDIIPDETSAGLNTIGIRMPNNEIALKLIELSGKPIAAPSANISGRPSPTEVERCVEDLDGKVDYILGGNKSDIGVESTIVDCTVNPPMVLRPGGITLEMLREVDSRIEIDKALMSKPSDNLKPKAPGMKYRHYAPKADYRIFKGTADKVADVITELANEKSNEGKKTGIITANQHLDLYKKLNKDIEIVSLGDLDKPETIANKLFKALRDFDKDDVEFIFGEAFSEDNVGLAIMNRLTKAAGYNITEV